MFGYRVGARWYAAALLTAPLVDAVRAPLALSLLFPEFLPGILTCDDKAAFCCGGHGSACGRFFRGARLDRFAVPTLRLQLGLLTTGLLVGVLWGAWHFLVNVWSSGTSSGAISLLLFLHSLLFSLGVLPAFRVLMVWVYERTESLLVSILMHASLTTGNIPARASGDGDDPRDLVPGVGSRAVGRRGGGRSGSRRAPLAPTATTTAEAGGLSKGGPSPSTGGRSHPRGG